MGAAGWDGISWCGGAPSCSQLQENPSQPAAGFDGCWRSLPPEIPFPFPFPRISCALDFSKLWTLPTLSCSCPFLWLCFFCPQFVVLKPFQWIQGPWSGELLGAGGNKAPAWAGRSPNSSVSCGSCWDRTHRSSRCVPVWGISGCGMSRGWNPRVSILTSIFLLFQRPFPRGVSVQLSLHRREFLLARI